jgi:phosphonoacetaldehyde hydrolase
MRLKAVIFDWAGTVVDFGSLCPVGAFQFAFSTKGVHVTPQDIQRFMGIRKWDHLRSLLFLPDVSAKWEVIHKRPPTDSDVNELYEVAEKRLLATVADFARPTPYLTEAITAARKRGLKVGSTTGYTKPLMEKLVPAAKRNGFAPDFWIASDQVVVGRPSPWMIFRNMEHLEVYPPCSVLKVGDTVADIEEADNAGVWSVGVAESSSLTGKSKTELEAMSARDRHQLLRHTSKQLADAGAHTVIPNLSDFEGTLELIEDRLEKGQLPPRLARRTSIGRRTAPDASGPDVSGLAAAVSSRVYPGGQ